jgi:hypothetical protein
MVLNYQSREFRLGCTVDSRRMAAGVLLNSFRVQIEISVDEALSAGEPTGRSCGHRVTLCSGAIMTRAKATTKTTTFLTKKKAMCERLWTLPGPVLRCNSSTTLPYCVGREVISWRAARLCGSPRLSSIGSIAPRLALRAVQQIGQHVLVRHVVPVPMWMPHSSR